MAVKSKILRITLSLFITGDIMNVENDFVSGTFYFDASTLLSVRTGGVGLRQPARVSRYVNLNVYQIRK